MKRLLGANQLARLDAYELIADAAVDGLPSRPTSANCLEEAVRSFILMRSRCQSSHADVTFRRPLPVFRVVRCLSVRFFQTGITVELFRCTRAPIAL
ncbi:uncharacterized protein TNCV_4399281 [Trichonephila clavipes]|nr:uncharacterized protein TNCV_4399281 [Trichonephila clavipes]